MTALLAIAAALLAPEPRARPAGSVDVPDRAHGHPWLAHVQGLDERRARPGCLLGREPLLLRQELGEERLARARLSLHLPDGHHAGELLIVILVVSALAHDEGVLHLPRMQRRHPVRPEQARQFRCFGTLAACGGHGHRRGHGRGATHGAPRDAVVVLVLVVQVCPARCARRSWALDTGGRRIRRASDRECALHGAARHVVLIFELDGLRKALEVNGERHRYG
mmetsp:Transcript_15585/g.40162  ORF Transcript_15585/g.40162 Transcript_15585/m.40162 type:complete len:223 (-) Transcript_15585:62-730(-)